MPSTTFPTARQFVTQLLNSLPSSPPAEDAAPPPINPLHNVPEDVKKQLLSLQVLFPNEFVPALDLLDRRLVTRFLICDEENENGTTNHPQPSQQPHSVIYGDTTTTEQNTDMNMGSGPCEIQLPMHNQNSENNNHNTIYYVRSAQPRPSRFSTSFDTTISYQVRLTAWNCSCPAFAFAAFPAVYSEPALPAHSCDAEDPKAPIWAGKSNWIFGGVSLGEGMPAVCKHLLACVLVERCKGLFGGFVEERRVGGEEAAGWAAGWGD